MNYRLRVTIEVVNQDGKVVDAHGHTDHPLKPGFFGLTTTQELREYAHIENAHTALNKTHALVRNLGEIMQ